MHYASGAEALACFTTNRRVKLTMSCGLWKTFTAHKAHLISSVCFHEAKPVKIALIGYGKMGREVEQVARKSGHAIAARIDPASDFAATSEISSQTIGSADVCIEFTHPEAAFGNIEKVVRLQKPLVVGTTGWYQHLAAVERQVFCKRRLVLFTPPTFL